MKEKIIKQTIDVCILMTLLMSPYAATASGWTTMQSGTKDALTSIWGTSPGDVFVAGGNPTTLAGVALYYNGASWADMPYPDDVVFSLWGTANNNIYSADFYGISHYNGLIWLISHETPVLMMGICGGSNADIFAVGANGTILHYNGSSWTPMSSGTAKQLNSVWYNSASDVFAVGYNGTILHYNGHSWSTMPSGTTKILSGVWGSSGDDVYAVGDAGTILHYNGSVWSAVPTGFTSNFSSVWGSSGRDVFVAGWGGIVHYDGTAWSAMDSGTSRRLFCVWGTSSADVFAAGEYGTILHYAGSTSTTTVPLTTTTTTVPATFVEISSFTAEPLNKEIIVKWTTESEIDNAGFNIYRSTEENGEYIKINDSLISAQGSSAQGASYELIDMVVKNRKTYYYKLEDIDLNGKSTMHGLVSATPRWIWGIFGK